MKNTPRAKQWYRRIWLWIPLGVLLIAFSWLWWLGGQPSGPLEPTPFAGAGALPTPTPFPPPTAGQAGEIWLHPVDEMQLVFIPAGPFLRGSPVSDPESEANERPEGEVYLEAYWIDQTEVTNRMYSLCVLEGGCEPPQSESTLTRNAYYDNLDYAEYPVVNVSWAQAENYCRWAGRRLPSEAEWEKAARGPQGARYPWGDADPNCDLLNFGNPGPGQGACSSDTTRVGSFPAGASTYGALDMAGNVFEWVADWYRPDAYRLSQDSNPTGPESGETRVLRGGALNDATGAVRAANRHQTHPENISYFIGFRCAVSATP